MNKTIWKQVSKEKFELFINSYPCKLSKDICHIVEPPIATFNDFTLGRWPDSIVAKICMDWLGPNGEKAKGDEYWEYFILSELDVDKPPQKV